MKPFVHVPLPTRVIFGRGRIAEAATEARRLGMARPMAVATPHQAASCEELARAVGGTAYPYAVMHTPVDVTEKAVAFVLENGIDGIVSLGGGSSTGLGKAIALRTDFNQLVIPTSYAGSEMTDILGETEGGLKTTRRDARIQPEAVIYDPDLLTTLPDAFAMTSGLNAIAHAVEGLFATDGNPIVSLMAEEGIRALAAALPKGHAGHDDALYGAWLCGSVLGSAAMALHHKLCHVLAGSFNLPHAETHAIVLPHATAYNATSAPEAMGRIARALGVKDAVDGLHSLSKAIGAPVALKNIGMPEDGLDKAADIAVSSPYPNPRPLERAAIRTLLHNAYHGLPADRG
ncbi:maleylacetate reductase [Mesorhizobium newzealandense]|uniref:Maleylacetate reductase n=1 Tax=Mesorhizobium newzealandense TaxID=1300302 RepID=A0ABW4UCP7_9HYPH